MVQIISSNINAVGNAISATANNELILVQDGVIVAANSRAISLGDFDNVTVSVAGTLASQNSTALYGIYTTLFNDGAEDATVHVLQSGSILAPSSFGRGISLFGGGHDITNEGSIISAGDGIVLTTIAYSGGNYFDGNPNQVFNSGLIQTNGTSTNNQTVEFFGFFNGQASLLNTGSIVNSASNTAIFADENTVLTLTNRGLIKGDVLAGVSGTNTQTIDNRGGEIIGDLVLGNGDDTFDNRGGAISGTVEGNGGDDTYLVSDVDLVLIEGTSGGSDTVKSTTTYALAANFENLTLLGTDDNNGVGNKEANIIVGNFGDNLLLGGGLDDTLSGRLGDDSLNGGNGGDTLNGDDGNDRLNGFRGDDTLRGGRDEDILYGGEGQDFLSGDLGTVGGDADMFVFRSVTESIVTAPDRITDFINGEDVLHLTRIDAIEGNVGDDAFTFIGGAGFSGTAGELRAVSNGSAGQVQGDTNGDGTADFRILFTNGALLTEDDIML